MVEIDATGHLRAIGAGLATIRASVGNLSGTSAIRVVPNFEGTWVGNVRYASCSGNADCASKLCGSFTCYVSFSHSRLYPSQVVFRQDRDQVIADLVEYPGRPQITGQIHVNGDVVFEDAVVVPGYRGTDVVTRAGWRLEAPTESGAMSGTFQQTFSDTGPVGTFIARVEVQMVDFRRSVPFGTVSIP